MASSSHDHQSTDRRRTAPRQGGSATRRALLSASVAGLTLPLAGCTGGSGGANGSDAEPLDVPFVDPAEDLDLLHEASDTEQLGVVERKPFVAPRPDGADSETDDGRIRRTEWGPTHLVYGPFENPDRLRVEAHHDGFQGLGTVDFSVSKNYDSGWESFEPTENVYNEYFGKWGDVGGKYRNSELTFEAFEDELLYIRLTLSKGYQHTTPQIGHVEIE